MACAQPCQHAEPSLPGTTGLVAQPMSAQAATLAQCPLPGTTDPAAQPGSADVGMQALVRERIKDWGRGLCAALGKRLVELTGDITPDLRALLAADVIVATPEKWDGISRAWHSRGSASGS